MPDFIVEVNEDNKDDSSVASFSRDRAACHQDLQLRVVCLSKDVGSYEESCILRIILSEKYNIIDA